MSAGIRFLQSWGVPIMMAGVYAVLMWSSDTDNTGKAWMAIGFGFVMVVWWTFRLLTNQAALSRAVSVGDAARTMELTGRLLARKKKPAARAPLLTSRALAHELRGEWDLVISTLDQVQLDKVPPQQKPVLAVLGGSARIGALLETGDVTRARAVLDDIRPTAAKIDRRQHPAAIQYAKLAMGRVLAAEGATHQAKPELQAVLDDVHAGGALRALAHFYLARMETEAPAARHRVELAKLIHDPAIWIRTAR